MTARLPRDLLERLDARARRERVPRSALLRRLLAEALEANGAAAALRSLTREVRSLRAVVEKGAR